MNMKDYKGAVADLLTCLKLNPGYPFYHFTLAEMYSRMGVQQKVI